MKTEKKPSLSVQTTVEVDMQTLSHLLCCAFEGGVGYWCQIQGYKHLKEAGSEFKSLGLRSDDKEFRHIWVPLTSKGVMILGEDADEDGNYTGEHVLDLNAIKNGLKVMANDCPRHFSNLMSDNYDAETGDVFIQCCIFSKVIYG
jgi:hypothetical protein